jgi:hypothetical protein
VKRLVSIAAGFALMGLGSAARAEWSRFETAHFIIYSEGSEKRAVRLATGLESIDGLMRMATGLPVATDPVKVRIYEMADEGEVQAALGRQGTGVAGFYTSNTLGPYAVTVRKAYSAEGDFTADIVLHHEYAHHFMLQYFPANYPGWYTEGFAELIGASKIMDDGRVAYGFPAKYRGDTLAFDWVPVQDVLLKSPEKLKDFDYYGQGWAMTHFLTFSKGRSQQLRQYLVALNTGKSPAEAATAFGDLDQLNREAHAYVAQGSFEYKPAKVAIQEPVIQRQTAVSAGEAALIPETIAFNDDDLGLYRKASDREEERKRRARVLEQIRKKAALFTADPYPLYLLAEAENASGNAAAAQAAVDRLLVLQPTHVRALVRKSLLLSEAAARLSGNARVEKAAEARRLAVQANKLNSDDPLTYVAFYMSARSAGSTVSADAVSGLEAAAQMLPADTKVRQLLVDEYAAEKHWAAAMRALSPIANDTHDSPLRQAARERMAQFQATLAAEPGAPGKP